MRSKGFTLIELLAVIVILAIIALIATPIILNIIEDARNESKLRSIEMYEKAVENAVAKAQLNGKEIPSGNYTEATLEEKGAEVAYDGEEIVCEGIYIADNGKVSISGCKIDGVTYGTKYYGLTKENISKGVLIGYNVTTGKSCSLEDASLTGKTGCLVFNVLADKGDRVDLLLDHDITGPGIDWGGNGYFDDGGCNYDSNTCQVNSEGPIGALDALKNNTLGWKAETPETYVGIGNDGIKSVNYVIDYAAKEMTTRLITSEEIKELEYINNNKIPVWLSLCSSNFENYSGNTPEGYWTANAYGHDQAMIVNECFIVEDYNGCGESGRTSYFSIDDFNNPTVAIRPVITVLKSNL